MTKAMSPWHKLKQCLIDCCPKSAIMKAYSGGAEDEEENGMFSMQEIGKRILNLRKDRNMTQMDLADQLGISYQAVSSWERGVSLR